MNPKVSLFHRSQNTFKDIKGPNVKNNLHLKPHEEKDLQFQKLRNYRVCLIFTLKLVWRYFVSTVWVDTISAY